MVVVALIGSLPAWAQSGAERPWAQGVAETEQAEALKLFHEGNVFFEQSQYSQAFERYKTAVQHWDHPAIRFNMAVSLINLDQLLEANTDLEKALSFGAAPFASPELYSQALTYQKLLQGRTTLVIVCKEPGAIVSLDGKEVFRGPGIWRQVLLPGEHQIVASKESFLTNTRSITLISGREKSEELKLQTVASATRYERRWAVWKPWVVFASGAVVALIGVGLELGARSDYNVYAQEVSQTCPQGCQLSSLPKSLAAIQTRAHTENVSAITMMSIGGAALATGIVLAIVNRERPVLPKEASRVSIAPVFGPEMAGLTTVVSF
jgi:hypothetical protein